MTNDGLFSDIVYNPNAPLNNNTAKKRAFYEPGDIIQDLLLTFENTSKPIFPIGVYDLPMQLSLSERVDDFNKDDGRILEVDTDKTFFNIASNVIRTHLFEGKQTKMSLFELIQILGKSAKKRLLIIDACRIPSGTTANVIREKRTLSRTLSMSGRKTCANVGAPIVNMRTLKAFAKLTGHANPTYKALGTAIQKFISDDLLDLYKQPKTGRSAKLYDILGAARTAGVVLRLKEPATAAAAAPAAAATNAAATATAAAAPATATNAATANGSGAGKGGTRKRKRRLRRTRRRV